PTRWEIGSNSRYTCPVFISSSALSRLFEAEPVQRRTESRHTGQRHTPSDGISRLEDFKKGQSDRERKAQVRTKPRSSDSIRKTLWDSNRSKQSKWQTLQFPPTGRLLPSSSRGPLVLSRARRPNPARRADFSSSDPRRFGDDIPGMEGLGTDITVVCPWEAFGDMELSDLAKYGIV
uniref:Retinal cone rhodopsin-sensitive cGMP 3',5'-cyclic phosphodiesterase subunit gamma n=1 Tax=Gasterosteus aculeatus aculeatus TaxID=481459 RepID=A0AAQ4P860_GASAC